MLRLLSSLPVLPGRHRLRCICFGMPAFGNVALGEHITNRDWSGYFSSYALPEDPVPRLSLSNGAGAKIPSHETTSNPLNGPLNSTENIQNSHQNSQNNAAATAAALEEELYREETPSNPSSGLNTMLAKEESSGPGEPKGFKWPFRGVARTAGTALRMPSLPPFLSYSHFGEVLYLTPRGISLMRDFDDVDGLSKGRKQENFLPPTPAPPAAPLSVPALGWPRNLLATHRMFAYRNRALEICSLVDMLPDAGLLGRSSFNGHGESSNGLSSINQGQLAPEIIIKCANIDLPVIWPPASTANPSSSSNSSIIQTFISSRVSKISTATKAGSSPQRARNRNLPTEDVSAYQNQTCKLEVGVWGEGLSMCTGAVLQLPVTGELVPGRIINFGGGSPQQILHSITTEIEHELYKLEQEPQGIRKIAQNIGMGLHNLRNKGQNADHLLQKENHQKWAIFSQKE